ncbi:MAG: hypothetical protein HGB34_04130 [Candidatus Moranbacteria bacterium]|nr:hypothetical protein [Candidatus Moranbacteria bacterium]NTW76058.1 hypothetical protein [Candidatus Moranbacteria bacterium]
MTKTNRQVSLTVTARINGVEKIYVISQDEEGLLFFSIRVTGSTDEVPAVDIAMEDVFQILARMLWFGVYPDTLTDFLESQSIKSAIAAKEAHGVDASEVSVNLIIGISDKKGTKTYSISSVEGVHFSSLGGKVAKPIGMGHIPCVVCVLLNMGATPNVPVEPKEATDACRAKMT